MNLKIEKKILEIYIMQNTMKIINKSLLQLVNLKGKIILCYDINTWSENIRLLYNPFLM